MRKFPFMFVVAILVLSIGVSIFVLGINVVSNYHHTDRMFWEGVKGIAGGILALTGGSVMLAEAIRMRRMRAQIARSPLFGDEVV